MQKRLPFGSWISPVTAEFVSGKDRILTSYIQTDGDNIYFIEQRPNEGGRSVLMCLKPDGNSKEILPNNFDVRTRYLEYSGLSYLVIDGVCYFVNFADQEIYATEEGKTPKRLTETKGNRFADLSLDKKRNRIIALREVSGQPESKNTICGIDLNTGQVNDLVYGADFYNCARINEDQLLWITWNHSNMPWNGTELWVNNLDHLNSPHKIAGDTEHAVAQARWGNNEEIYFAAELSNYMNLYKFKDGKIENVYSCDGDFTFPDWVPGAQQYAISKNGTICATYIKKGRWQIVLVDQNGTAQTLIQSFGSVSALHAYKDKFIALVGYSTKPATLVQIDSKGELEELYSPNRTKLSSDFISVAEEIQYPTEDGSLGYAWFYPPKSPNFKGLDNEKPPLIVCAHGGPTSMSMANFRKDFQFWTTRGYAVVDVNYGGSSGYGRNYRERLRENWGLVDVSDCVLTVRELAARGLIDPNRVAIRGSSAGGYTTLASLAFTKGVFTVGASYYGVSDLELLARETHKLESRYLHQLIGPYPLAIEAYKARAPLEHVERFNCPIVFFQGDEDRVVPPNQSELMHKAIKQKGIPTEYYLYNKEGHGFRRAETTQHALKSEHAFYARFFKFEIQEQDRIL